MARSSILAALLWIAAIGTPHLVADEPSLKGVLRRMGAYVLAYGEKASIVVAAERYTQRVANTRPGAAPDDRVIVADFAIVRARGGTDWIGFRDVVEVDGARVSDREDRLIRILTSSTGSWDDAKRLSDESARFNIGPVQRNFNVPTTALFFFTADNLDRFKFTRKGAVPGGIWEVDFRETSRPTLVRTPQGKSIPSEGTLWVNESDGTITRTRLHMRDFAPRSAGSARGYADIDVIYQRVATLDMWLPETMTEVYGGTPGVPWDRITTRAQYSDYRQFQTAVRIK
jgi:hypothetical protein